MFVSIAYLGVKISCYYGVKGARFDELATCHAPATTATTTQRSCIIVCPQDVLWCKYMWGDFILAYSPGQGVPWWTWIVYDWVSPPGWSTLQ